MSFLKVRKAHKTENTEDYLELISDLLNKYGEVLKLGNTNYSLTFQFDKLYSNIRN